MALYNIREVLTEHMIAKIFQEYEMSVKIYLWPKIMIGE